MKEIVDQELVDVETELAETETELAEEKMADLNRESNKIKLIIKQTKLKAKKEVLDSVLEKEANPNKPPKK